LASTNNELKRCLRGYALGEPDLTDAKVVARMHAPAPQHRVSYSNQQRLQAERPRRETT